MPDNEQIVDTMASIATEPAPAPAEPAAAEPEAAPAAPATPSISPEVLELRSAIAQQQQAISAIGGVLGQLVGQQGAQPTDRSVDSPPPTNEANEAELQKFLADPQGYLREAAIKPAVEAVREQLGPHLQNQAIQRRDELLNEAREMVEERFGEGVFDKDIMPHVSKALEKMPLQWQSSREHLLAAVSGVLGHLYLRGDATTLDKAKAAKRQAPAMLDSTRARPRGDAGLTPEEKSFVAALQRSDPSYTEASYLKARQRVAARKGN